MNWICYCARDKFIRVVIPIYNLLIIVVNFCGIRSYAIYINLYLITINEPRKF